MNKKVFVLTGAGISAESGIKTFRDSGGLWEDHRIEDVATPEGFLRDPELVHKFYNLRRAQLDDLKVAPNLAHITLANYEKTNNNIMVVTQNVDNLHERAGTRNLFHMHGELLKIRCMKTGKIYQTKEAHTIESICDCCNESGNLRPHIVWFGEMPLYMDEINRELIDCDIFISIGTSGNVYPASMLVDMTPPNCRRVELNFENTPVSNRFDESINGPATEIVPEFFKKI